MQKLIVILMTGLLAACGGSSGNSTAETTPAVMPDGPQTDNSDQSETDNPDPSETDDSEQTDIDKQLKGLIDKQHLANTLLDPSVAPGTSGPLFELGKELFFSKALSGQMDVACVSCHHPQLGGGDNLSLPVGVDAVDPDLLGPGRTHNGNRKQDHLADGAPNVPRNAPTTFNIQLYNKVMFWDGRIEVTDDAFSPHGSGQALKTPDSLFDLPDPNAGDNLSAAQARFPITSITEMLGHIPAKLLTNERRREMLINRFTGQGQQAADLTKNDWLPLFQQAFNDTSDNPEEVITMARITEALSLYQRSQLFINNPWFDYLKGNSQAITEQQKTGAILFFSEAEDGGYGCSRCHSNHHFSDEQFHNLAIPQFGRGKNLFQTDPGRLSASKDIKDTFKFRTPSLLNTEVTGPWGHTGAYETLEGIVRHHLNISAAVNNYDYSLANLHQFKFIPDASATYQQLTRSALEALQASDDWKNHPRQSVNETHLSALVAFLNTLTDPCTKDAQCLSVWLPEAQTESPDNLRLNARFSDFNQQLNTYTPADTEDDNNTDNDDDRYFSDVSVAAGLNYPVSLNNALLNQHQIMSGGVSVADYDQDGWDDLFISHARGPGKLLRNQADGTFSVVTSGVFSEFKTLQLGGLFIDVDDDGDSDLLLSEASKSDQFRRVLINDNGIFKQSNNDFGLSFNRHAYSYTASDYDNDGDLDLYTAHWGVDKTEKDLGFLWNKGNDKRYSDVSDILPAQRISPVANLSTVDVAFSANMVDIDGDHDSDILLSGDFETSQVLVNNGSRFVDITNSVITDENGMGGAVGDYDNDGDLDWFVTSIHNPADTKAYIGGESGNRLYQNDGTGSFTDQTDKAGVREGFWGWGTCFADFNNDGWLDLFHTNGMYDGHGLSESIFSAFFNNPSRLFINNQDGTFSEKAMDYGIGHTGQGRGISCLDYDNDGDIDILIANNDGSPTLYRNNDLDKNNFLTVRLSGEQQNIKAVGAKLWLTSGGLTQYRQLQLGSNYLSNNPVEAHFGLGKKSTIEELRIRWPDGSIQVMTSISINQRIRIHKSGDITVLTPEN